MDDPTSAKLGRDLSNEILLMHIPPPPDKAWIAKIEDRYPGLKIRWFSRPWTFETQLLPDDVYEGVTMVCAVTEHPAEKLPKLHCVQLASAGADRWLGTATYMNPDVIFCTSNGTHPPQIAEWVIATYLMHSHHLLAYAAAQQTARVNRLLHLSVQDSPGLRMGILGYGAIGRQCARLGSALGMEVYAYTRSPKLDPESRKDDSYCVPGTGDPDGLIPSKWFHGTSREETNDFLAQDLDVLVLSLPLTEATRYILGREQFEILGRTKKAFVSNIARGKHIDTDALLDALKTGKIRGAALDVTDPEPLPDGHELFTAPNVFLTPHVSWKSEHYFERVQAIIETNLERLSKGKGMVNVIDRVHHY
ncbi:hypothetical protein B0H66DRAFT_373600 [Apodospora peruviana]|uniref:D-isomer specific 2-hydroxyacid dehydrogenase NAD-binding domain-containing protein n=1 Tax=Apodospora peruviana TaxID=516989 RepID=A0AAE0M008_9PEZI|nr:hypothetical protein B0H66DRAFT_373600 [Apodospora peruviana]